MPLLTTQSARSYGLGRLLATPPGTFDLIETTSELLKTNDPLIRKERLQKAESLYGISKQFTNYFLFKLDNEIFVYTSQETDKFKKYKYNNILSYIILLIMFSINFLSENSFK